MKWYWYLYDNCWLFRTLRHFYLYVLKIDWQLQIVAIIMLACLALIMRKKVIKREIKKKQAVAATMLPVYVFILFSSLVLSRQTGDASGYRLNPFWKWVAVFNGDTMYIKEIILNVVMLLPYGFLLPVMLPKANFLKTLVSGVVISVLIEVLQLITRTGLCETSDIIHNTIGILAGYCLFILLRKNHKETHLWRKR